MKLVLKFATIILVIGTLFHISCKKEYSCEGCNEKNKPPIAVAGPDQVITLPTDSVLLDGKNSSDQDGKISEWLWTKISGPASFNIIKPSDSTRKVKALVAGTYQLELKVKDNGGLSAKDTMQIIVDRIVTTNHPPIANAGGDQTIILPTNNVTLDGSGSSDPDNNITSYGWTKISGPSSFTITNSNAVQTQVTNLAQGIYRFELKVTDVGGLFSKDTVQLTVNITTPDPCTANRPIINAQLIPFGTLSDAIGAVAVASAGNKIVFAGGWGQVANPLGGEATSRVDIYDIVTHNWSTAELSAARSAMTVAVCGTKIFFAGGQDGNVSVDSLYRNVDIYDASNNTWSVATLSSARNGLAAASVGNRVFFAGGQNPSIGFVNTVDIYDLTTNTWSTATLSEARGYISASVVGNRIYFAGGFNSNLVSSVSNRIDIYDNATSSWSVSTLYAPNSLMASIAFDGKIYWAGGSTALDVITSKVEIRDVTTQTSSFACLFQPNAWSVHWSSAVKKDNKLIFSTGRGTAVNKFDIYDIATNTWSIGLLPQEEYGASIISVNNTIYMIGYLSNQVWKLEF